MKKYLAIFFAVLLAATVAFSIGAADAGLTVEIDGKNVVSAGETVSYTFTVGNITVPGGILGADVHASFDTSVFEYVSASGKAPEAWGGVQINASSASSGRVNFTAMDANAKTPTSAAGSIVLTLTLKVKSSASAQSQIGVTLVQGTGADFEVYKGTCSPLSVSVKQSLPAPTGLTFANGVAKWSAVANADSYSIQLYKDGKEYGDPVPSDKTEWDFSKTLTEGGKYCFTVIAVSDKPEYGDSAESAKSGDYTVVGKLAAPKIALTSDFENGGLKYQITDTNADGTVRQYIIDLYEKGGDSSVKTITVPSRSKAGNIPCDDTVSADKEYTATVTAVTENTAVNTDSDTSAHSAAAAAVRKVRNIRIKTQPKLVYVEGEALDLSALVVTVNYEDGDPVDVAFADFRKYNLTVSIADGKVLAMSDHNKSVVVSFGDKSSASTSPLTVNSNVCKHTSTHPEEKTPSCGENGYQRQICDACGAVVSETVLPATNEHQFGDWQIVANPTETLKGVKERVCHVCGFKETEEIPPTGAAVGSDDDPQTQPPVTSDAGGDNTTEPPVSGGETTAPTGSGGMSDLSQIFLIVVIVIFSLILLFIVGAVWLENRRSKARRARAGSRGNANRSNHPNYRNR